MPPAIHPPALLETLAQYDTPTICNALEQLDPQTTHHGFTREPLICAFPNEKPRVGYARTQEIRTTPAQGEDRATLVGRRLDYFDYVEAGDGPKIVISKDLDGPHGLGACWGDVMANVHLALGCVGAITDGAFRDVPGVPPAFQLLGACEKPSHARLHTIAYGRPVDVAGMVVRHGDLVHMDRNGATVIPHALAAGLPDAIAKVIEREQRIIAASREPGFGSAKLRELFG